MIECQNTKPYKRKVRSNRVEYSTTVWPYCTNNELKVTFFMSKFSSIKIISHCFHVYKNEVEVGIVNDIIIDHDLVVQLGI